MCERTGFDSRPAKPETFFNLLSSSPTAMINFFPWSNELWYTYNYWFINSPAPHVLTVPFLTSFSILRYLTWSISSYETRKHPKINNQAREGLVPKVTALQFKFSCFCFPTDFNSTEQRRVKQLYVFFWFSSVFSRRYTNGFAIWKNSKITWYSVAF